MVTISGNQNREKKKKFIDRRDQVLRVAARIFAENGYRQTTLEDVADTLQITRAALYYYTHSKDDLAAACSDRARDQLNDALANALAQETTRDKLITFFQRYAEVICDDFGRCFVTISPQEISESSQAQSRSSQRQLDRAVRDIIATGIADGSFRAVDPRQLSRALFGAFNGISRWYRPGGLNPTQIANDFLDLFLCGISEQS
jgi:TetR/AcrR family transcriptional regulator, cholesterol catabolism regulator